MLQRSLLFGIAALACSCGTSAAPSPGNGTTCGEGTVLRGTACVAVPIPTPDAGSAADVTVPPPPVTPRPTFAGVTAAAPASASRLLVTWDPAKDERTPPAAIVYRVYAGKTDRPLALVTPTAQTLPGATSIILDKLDVDAEYAVTVRAVNEAGVEDTNTAQKRATLLIDVAPPTFAGVKTASAASSGAVLLTWDSAADDHSAPQAISYLVYVASSPRTEDFARPALITAPGATSALMTGLVSPELTRFFVVRARDASDNVDANKVELAAQPAKDTTPPIFGGCTAAVTASPSEVTVSWSAATDETTPAAQIAYDVFAARTSGGQDFGRPSATAVGTTGVTVSGLSQTTRYYFVCRARDLGENSDSNRVERSATTTTDPSPPTFAGLTSATLDAAARTVTLDWAPATDDQTLPQNIVYDVYEATTSLGQAFDAPPRASSAPGASTITVTNLLPDTDLFWVVRARDEGLNHDANTVEATGRTDVSFSRNVQPIFNHDCAVVGCHVPGNPTGGLVLTQGFSYASLVGVPALENRTVFYVAPSNAGASYLRAKLEPDPPRPVPFVGTLMPAPSTGSVLTPKEIDTIKRWIQQGASNN